MAVDIDKLQIEIEASSNDAAQKVRELADALEQLKKSIGGGGGGLGGVKDKIKGIGDSADKASKSFNLFKGVLSGVGVRRITSYLGGAVASMNEYVETVNLFQVAMGGYYEEAKNYAELVNQRLGVDPAQWMRTQGVFMSMGKGFGMAENQAYDLSESLTELSYDIASLYNEDIESAATRLQSALAGEIEPIRRLGISISQATLQEYALSRGIQENVANMTEQEKALLRSLKLIEDAGKIGAIGDFAKTLESPANAVRVLTQQFEQLKRAIGSVFLPIVVQTIPYVQAFTSVLTDMITGLATLVGFEMPKWESSSWESTADAVGDTTAAVKKLKQATIGIDELNIIGQNGGGAGASGGLSDWAADIEIPDLWNKEEIAAIETKAGEIKERLEPILDIALEIGKAFLLIKFAGALFDGIKSVKDGLKNISDTTTILGKGKSIAIGVVLAAEGFWTGWKAIEDILENGLDWENIAESIIGGAEFVAGAALIGNAFGVGIKTAAIAAIVVGVAEFGAAFYDAVKNGVDVENVFSMVVGGAVTGGAIGLLFGPGGALAGAILGGLAGTMTSSVLLVRENWDEICADFEEGKERFKKDWDELKESFKQKGEEITGWIRENWTPAWGYFVENAKKNWGDTKLAWDTFCFNIKSGWETAWTGIKKVTVGIVNGIIGIVEGMTNGIVNGVNWVIRQINKFSVSIPDWDIFGSMGGKNLGFNLKTLNKVSLPRFEMGGFPEHGQMFIAREAGPELVGQIGSRTAIANNNQIIGGIAGGVREANEDLISVARSIAREVVRAIQEKDANVYFDGKKVTKRISTLQKNADRMYGR